MAALRMAHRTLGLKRNRMGMGLLGAGGAVLAIAISSPGLLVAPAKANTTIGGGTVAAPTTAAIAIGTGDAGCGPTVGPNSYASIVMGCGASANITDPTNYTPGAGLNGPTVIGVGSNSTGANAITFGNASASHGDNAISIGTGSVAGVAGAAIHNTIAIGRVATATGAGSTAIGFNPNATGVRSLALGFQSVATDIDAVAQGTSARAAGQNAVALGFQATATTINSIYLGSRTVVGTGALAEGAIAIGTDVTASQSGAIAVGRLSKATANTAIAVGSAALADADDAVAIGTNAKATGGKAVSIGAGNTAYGAGAVSIGDPSYASGTGAFTGGANNIANSDGTATATAANQAAGAVAIGNNNKAIGQGSVALGNGSTAGAAGLAGNVAIGDGAVASANARDVALGSGSVTAAAVRTGGATIGGNAYTFAGATPTSTVSIGALGSERTITNVAAGRLSNSSTDAVNGSQLFATNQQVDLNTTAITNLGGNVTNLGNTINNIAGNTSTTYTDANGHGIRYARTNDRTLAVTDSFAQGIGSTAIGYNATAVANNSLALGRESRTTIDGSVALGSSSVSDRVLAPITGQINAGPTGLIQYNTTDKTLLGAVSVGTSTAYRQIVNVADGTAANDAVTLRQLQGAIASVSVTPTKYFHANSAAVDSLAVGAGSIAVGPTTVVNGDNGVGIGNGAIVDQTAPGGTAIGQGAHVARADGIALGTLSNASGVQSVALGAGSQSTHTNSVALGAQSVTTVGAQAGYTGFALTAPRTSFGEVSIGAAGKERKLTNVAAGSAETDAVNVSQLRGLGTQVTNLFGGGTVVNPDGSITGPTYNIQGNSYTTVYDGFTAVNNAITNINNGGGIKYFHANSALADSIASGTNSVAIGPQSVASGNNSVAAGNGAIATGNGSIALGQGAQANNANDVALGSGSTSQPAVGTSGATIKGTRYAFAGVAPVGTVSVGSAGAERTVTNVAAGRISETSTDAINGSQLNATNQAIESLQTGVGTITKNAVQYDLNSDGSKKNSITLQGGDINAPVIISNVGVGVANNDAVNVGQLKQTVTEAKTFAIQTANNYTDTVATKTLGQANDYTDQKFNQLNQELDGVRSEARQAAAIGLAAASLRYDDRPGKLSVAVGGGLWRSESALAFGAGYTSENGRVRGNVSGTASGGHVGVGAGLSFTLN